jgi:toxin ParE1/3/4
MTNVLLTPEAERDLEEIGDYIAEDNPARAVSFIQEIRDQCNKIGNAPLAYAARPELGEDIRSCPHGRHYVIFFLVDVTDRSVLIVRILHGARDLPSLFGDQ